MSYHTEITERLAALSFALRAGISHSMLFRFLKGENIGVKYVEKIAFALECRLSINPLDQAETPTEPEEVNHELA